MATSHKKESETSDHKNIDGTHDRRFDNNGQGKVTDTSHDMRLVENRNDPKKVKEHAKATQG